MNGTPNAGRTRKLSFSEWLDWFAKLVTNIRTLVLFFASLVVLVIVSYVLWRSGLLKFQTVTASRSLQISGFQVTEVMPTDSRSLDATIGTFYKRAFTITGGPLDYRRAPDQKGYVIQYTGTLTGIGNCDVNFVVVDLRTHRVITPQKAQIEAVPVVQDYPLNTEFFVATSANEKPRIIITINLEPGIIPKESKFVDLSLLPSSSQVIAAL